MKSKRYAMTILGLVAVVGAALCATRPAPEPPALPDPATMRLEYRPGVYFPEGFPLHGEVKLLSAPVVEAGKRTRVRFEYAVGDLAIEEGMRLEIWKHFTSDVEGLQIEDPDRPAHFTAESSSAGVEFESQAFSNSVPTHAKPSVFPYRRVAAVDITSGSLKKGDKVVFDLGGPLGVTMQTWQENLFNFRVVIVRAEDGKVLGYGGDAIMKITGGPLHKLTVQAPAMVALGEGFTVEVVPQDKFGSLAKNHQGLKLRITSENVGGSALEYEPELLHYVAHNVVANAEGVLRIEVETEDGAFRSVSNPIWVEQHPLRRVFYGDLHQHTYMADGRGIPEELYLYARRVALLDFGAVSPHKGGLYSGANFKLEDLRFPRDKWPDLVRANKIMNGWKGFVPILGYEYGGSSAGGGHHNIYYIDDEAPTTMQLDPNDRGGSIAKMLEILKRARQRALVIPHVGGGPPDWKHLTDQRIERLFEIASVHGVFEESWQKHLEAGVRLGASASGDNHMTSFGSANPGLEYIMSNGLTGVYAYNKTRDDIWNALYEKRTFAVTGHTRMLMDFEVNGEPMGGELASTHAATAKIRAKVSGTAPLVRIDLLKNSKVIHSVNPARNRGNLLRVSWGDNLYVRRANTGLANGQLKAAAGKLLLRRVMHLDNSFEHVEQNGDAITWTTAATSNDREAVLVDLSEVQGDSLSFHLEDPTGFHTLDVEIPLAQLKRDGFFSWSTEAPEGVTAYKKDYMKMMGVEPRFFLDCELVSDQHPMDYELLYEDRNPPKPGDYYYVRVEQLDTNRAWSSPVWVN